MNCKLIGSEVRFWCGCTWCMEFIEPPILHNIKKFKSMTLLRKKLKAQSSPIILLESQLDNADSIKYLGLTIQSDLTWSKYIQNICSKARRLVGMLFCQFYYYAESSTIKTLYLTLIRPNLEYASIVWDPHLIKGHKVLENVQKFACRVCTKNWHTDYQSLLDGLYIPSMEARRKVMILCFI